MQPHQEELLRRCPDLDPADVPQTWSGAADLDEQIFLNKQKRLAQEEAAKIRPAPIRQPDAPVSRNELRRELGKVVEVLATVQEQFERRMGDLADAQMKFVGVWKRGQAYSKGAFATHQGSGWHCNADTTAEPGTSADWTLSIKRGRDGKDGKPVRRRGKSMQWHEEILRDLAEQLDAARQASADETSSATCVTKTLRVKAWRQPRGVDALFDQRFQRALEVFVSALTADLRDVDETLH